LESDDSNKKQLLMAFTSPSVLSFSMAAPLYTWPKPQRHSWIAVATGSRRVERSMTLMRRKMRGGLMVVVWCCVAAGCSTFGVGRTPSPDATLPSAPPCPGPAVDTRTWREYSVLIPEGVFRIRLPAGWMHTPSHAGLYPRGADADGPYWSTDWARQNNYFQQWVQPAGNLTLKDSAPRDIDAQPLEYRACEEDLAGTRALFETQAYAIPMDPQAGDLRRYAASMMLQVKAGGWLVVSGIFETRHGQEEFLTALRTVHLLGE
jgi:hypothetical protein